MRIVTSEGVDVEVDDLSGFTTIGELADNIGPLGLTLKVDGYVLPRDAALPNLADSTVEVVDPSNYDEPTSTVVEPTAPANQPARAEDQAPAPSLNEPPLPQ